MASNLRSITDAVANLSISYTNEAGATVTPTAKDINQIPVSVAAADAPIRLVGVVDEGGNESRMDFIAVDDNVEYMHEIIEKCLVESVGLSRRMDELPDQQRYSDAMLSKLADSRSIYTNSDIVAPTFCKRDVIEWPEGTDEHWYAVITHITVRELA